MDNAQKFDNELIKIGESQIHHTAEIVEKPLSFFNMDGKEFNYPENATVRITSIPAPETKVQFFFSSN